jgi:Uncharacterized protein conserved in bacteria (DUF2135)
MGHSTNEYFPYQRTPVGIPAMIKILRSTLLLPLILLPILVNGTTPAEAQERQGCFMVNDSGRLVDLGEVCSEERLGTGDIQITLRWGTSDDLDLSVVAPNDEEVDYRNRVVSSSGELDVDANADCKAEATPSIPIENVYWPDTQAPSGRYTIAVNLFNRCSSNTAPIPFTLRLLNHGTVQTFRGEVKDKDEPQEFTFSFEAGLPLAANGAR